MDKPLSLKDFVDTWQELPFEYFREGVDIHHIRKTSPAVAILRYAPGAKVPLHLHTGLESILVLDGVQSDERGDYSKGALILNPEGSQHSVWSETGCAVLIQWERPVQILG
ncbi:cupin domain-containing protein [Jannaschia sp. M317]|uniref:cupin domain-containing protein n=1 Tax=Jannaschia sp. M317 TaxID=2867011 RepID=UPI0021A732B1|nr:cupin domain-containing protein [Jannaschia sp. M317]UWQ16811.1 cupin domain-containing protein [Jannaschia sp. M317]